MDSNRKLILEDSKKWIGRYFHFGINETVVVFFGAVDLMDDYYWVGATKSGALCLSTCVGKPDFYPENNIQRDGDLITVSHTKFLDTMTEEEKDNWWNEVREKMLEEIRHSGINWAYTYDVSFRKTPELINDVVDRLKNPENYIIYHEKP